jgi:endogenous inhibitor of DNA gyrase (YacG/DUF329 family)
LDERGTVSEIKLRICPVCGRTASAKLRPFCSVRCADVDLGRWLTGSYAIPVAEDEAEEENEGDTPYGGRPGHSGTA